MDLGIYTVQVYCCQVKANIGPLIEKCRTKSCTCGNYTSPTLLTFQNKVCKILIQTMFSASSLSCTLYTQSCICYSSPGGLCANSNPVKPPYTVFVSWTQVSCVERHIIWWRQRALSSRMVRLHNTEEISSRYCAVEVVVSKLGNTI